ncbi:MAG: cache domain-containing protein, partial [Chloroflexota bacterium]
MTWFSVRAKLLAFACIVLAPVALVAYFTAQNYVAATRAQVLNSSAATANVAVASADDFLATAERLLLILAATSAVQKNDAAETGDLFANTLSLSPEYLSLYVLDANDHLQVKIPNEPATDNDMRYGVEALRRGSPTISGRLGTPERLTAALAVPIRRNAQVSGALGVEFALDRLQRNLAESVMREHAVVLLFDGDGKVLVAPESPFYSEAIDWRSVPAVQAVLRGEQGAAEYRSPVDGRQWLGAYAPVRRANWAVLVSYPSDEVFAPVRMATLTAALSLGGVIVLALVMAVWLAARFTRPLQQVKATALSIAQGDYGQRVPQVALPHDEVGQLAVAFNQMADALHDHMVALLDAQREIEQKAMDLQQLLDRSVTVQEAERKRIAQEIHDGITQMLVGAIYEMQAAKQSLASSVGTGVQRPELVEGQRLPQQQVALKKLGDALTLVSETVSEIRRVIFDLHPTILDELGLVPALHRLVTTSESDTLRCVFQVEGAPTRLSSAQELALYRITQEALNNVRQHAEARHARVAL